MSDIRMQIGQYTFSLAPKDAINFSLAREIYKLDTVGTPTYQDMGIGDKSIQFTGTINASDAWNQAELIESIMDEGLPQTLLYGSIQKTVRIASFNPKLKRFDRVDYDITLTIIPLKSGYNAVQQPATVANSTLPTKPAPATTSTASIGQHLDTTYIVRSGDTLWGIAQRILGSGASSNDIATLANTLAKGNGISNPRSLSIGQKLKIPSTNTRQTDANAAYTARQVAVVTSTGINYLQTQEASVRFKAVSG